MPEYRFIVQSAQGRVRKGRIHHDSKQAAREQLESAGFAVVELVESTSPPSGNSENVPSGRIDMDGLFDRVPVKVRNGVLLSVILLGVVVAFVSRPAASSRTPSPSSSGQQTPQPVSLNFSASVDNQSADPIQVILHLPQVPYSFSPTEVDPVDGGTFSVEKKLQLDTAPSESICEVWSVQNGKTRKQLAAKKAIVTGQTFDFGTIVVK